MLPSMLQNKPSKSTQAATMAFTSSKSLFPDMIQLELRRDSWISEFREMDKSIATNAPMFSRLVIVSITVKSATTAILIYVQHATQMSPNAVDMTSN
jgi:hypothetical protein